MLQYWFGTVWGRTGLSRPYPSVGSCIGRTAARTVCGEEAYTDFSAPVLFQAVAATAVGRQTAFCGNRQQLEITIFIANF